MIAWRSGSHHQGAVRRDGPGDARPEPDLQRRYEARPYDGRIRSAPSEDTMLGIMQDRPLLISTLIEHANVYHRQSEIVSRTVEGPVHRCTYADIAGRSKQVAKALIALGVKPGDRIATLAWNGYRHMELYYGVSGMGA